MNYVKSKHGTDLSEERPQATLPIGITEFDAEHREISSQKQIEIFHEVLRWLFFKTIVKYNKKMVIECSADRGRRQAKLAYK